MVALLVMGACALATAQDQIHAHAGVGAGTKQADAQGLRKLEDTTGKSQQPRADGAPMNLRQDGLPLLLAYEHPRKKKKPLLSPNARSHATSNIATVMVHTALVLVLPHLCVCLSPLPLSFSLSLSQ